ncbi:TonB-dependent receptor plug domain-containing protein [Aquimarina rubra]|uniref:TonB-dependent receptor plug domain-containing protein n=1 Tax=Aquimarina rubra TaxID=1920033 RepID=A0ABW5LEQ3_9FLAO
MGRSKILIVSILCVFFFLNSSFNEFSSEEDIIIYWDASFSQKDKNFNKEFQFLDAYFNNQTNIKVSLIVFNTEIISEDIFTIRSSHWNDLKNKLENITYDGESDFSLINTKVDSKLLFLFTDGNSNFGEVKTNLYSPRIITVSSQESINKKELHELAYYNRGYYVNLLENDISTYIKAIKNQETPTKLEFITRKKAERDMSFIEGVITDGEKGLPNVNILLKGKNKGTITDKFGNYQIAAKSGDILVFSAINMKRTEVEVGDENIIDINLTEKLNQLEPTVIKAKGGGIDSEIIKVGDKLIKKRSLGYSVSSITSDDISDINRGLGEAMAGEFAGVQMGVHNDPGLMIIRGFSSFQLTNHPAFFIDGVPLPVSGVESYQKENYDFIDPNMIKDITVLRGIAATNLYGKLGVNGVVLITTKHGSLKFKEAKKSNEPKIDYDIYEGPLELTKTEPTKFIKSLQIFSEIAAAYSYYLDQRKDNKKNVTFFLESAEYFFLKGEKSIGLRILSNLSELFPEDTSVLKILAFHLEKYEMFEKAQHIYNRIIEVSPTISQTYLNLANSYFEDKKYQKSVDLFTKISSQKINKVNSFNGLQNQINNDFKNLLSNRTVGWKLNKIRRKYFNLPKYDLRIVTEWSHPQTEFEMQYINPKKQYFVLSHTPEKHKRVMDRELLEGFTSEEYILADAEKGRWFLSLKPTLGYNSDLKYPKFLKIKIYTDFGREQEKLQTHIINLDRVSEDKIFAYFTID